MTQQQIIERVVRTFSDVKEGHVRLLINQTQKEFARLTRLLRKTVELQAGGNGVDYALPTDLIDIRGVYYDPDATATSQFAAATQGPRRVKRMVSIAERVRQTTSEPVYRIMSNNTIRIGTASTTISAVTTGVFTLTYAYTPADFTTTLTTESDIPDDFMEAIYDRIFEKLWRERAEPQLAAQHFASWKLAVQEGKREANSGIQGEYSVPLLHEI